MYNTIINRKSHYRTIAVQCPALRCRNNQRVLVVLAEIAKILHAHALRAGSPCEHYTTTTTTTESINGEQMAADHSGLWPLRETRPPRAFRQEHRRAESSIAA